MSDQSNESAEAEESLWGVAALDARRSAARRHQAKHAATRVTWIRKNQYYYDRLVNALRFIILPQERVLNVRCMTGYLLEAVDPAYGVGIDLTEEMIEVARRETGSYRYEVADPEDMQLKETFDYILLSNVNDITDVIRTITTLNAACLPHTRLVIFTPNHLWRSALEIAEQVKLRVPSLEQNWLTEGDLKGILDIAGFEWIRTYRSMLLPYRVPFLSKFLNDFVGRIPGISRLSMINFLVARPIRQPRDAATVSVSVIVPCKDERGNIEAAAQRIPEMGKGTEIIFCNDNSTDGTREEIERVREAFPERRIRLVDGPGVNKALNVWSGFDSAEGDVLMILDGDLTVMPEELPYFFNAIVQGKGEFINGVRLVYPLQRNAMKSFNLLGNKVFVAIFSIILGQRVKDTLCGTKVLWRSDWQRIKPLIGSWGTADRWGDFELLLGAAKLNLRIIDLPVHYQERIFGVTKMVSVVNNGINMMRLSFHAFIKLKFGF